MIYVPTYCENESLQHSKHILNLFSLAIFKICPLCQHFVNSNSKHSGHEEICNLDKIADLTKFCYFGQKSPHQPSISKS